MPTIFVLNGFRFFFVSFDCAEPMHVHVTKGEKTCKYWVKANKTAELADNYKFTKKELNAIASIIVEKYTYIKRVWDEHCKDTPKKKYKK